MTRVVVQRGLGTSTQSQSRNAVHAPPTSVPAQQPSSQPLASSPPQQEAAVRSSDFPNSSLSTDDPSASSTSNAAAASSVTILIPEEAAKRDRVKDGNEHESGATIQPLPLSQDQSFQSSSTCEPASRHESSRANSSQHISEPPRSSLSSSSSRRGSWTGVSAAAPRPGVMFRRPSRISPTSNGEGDGYNSADESGTTGFDDEVEGKERHFENELRRVKGFELRRMAEDGNCLFRALADQVYGDPEMYDETRQMCIDYMEKERDHFSQFVTESFTAYCKRKRRDKAYGNNLEIQAMAEMYNRPIHIHCYSTDPINIFHGHYETDLPPIRLSYHRKNHYNSLHDPSRPAVGAGLGFGSLRGGNVDREQVKAAIRAQQEQQIDKALVAEGRYYSDLEVTEQEIERMVMEASRAEYLAQERHRDEACSAAAAGGGGDGGGGGGDGEPSSSRGGGSDCGDAKNKGKAAAER